MSRETKCLQRERWRPRFTSNPSTMDQAARPVSEQRHKTCTLPLILSIQDLRLGQRHFNWPLRGSECLWNVMFQVFLFYKLAILSLNCITASFDWWGKKWYKWYYRLHKYRAKTLSKKHGRQHSLKSTQGEPLWPKRVHSKLFSRSVIGGQKGMCVHTDTKTFYKLQSVWPGEIHSEYYRPLWPHLDVWLTGSMLPLWESNCTPKQLEETARCLSSAQHLSQRDNYNAGMWNTILNLYTVRVINLLIDTFDSALWHRWICRSTQTKQTNKHQRHQPADVLDFIHICYWTMILFPWTGYQ